MATHGRPDPRPARSRRRVTTPGRAAAGIGALAGVGGVVRWAAPASPLPPPTGPHPVGTTIVELEGPRTLPVQVWYPARAANGPGAPLFPASAGVARALAARYRIPAWTLRPIRRSRGTAIADATPAWTPADDGPVRGAVVISHGWLGFRTMHADLAEQLASEGWIVVAPDHVGGALAAQHPDGRVTGLEATLMPPDDAPDYRLRTAALVARYAEDLEAVVDAVAAGALSPLLPRADGVWLIGQSTGGGAATALAARDPRVRGVLGLDPWVQPVPSEARAALDVPMIAVRSGEWVGNGNDRLLTAMPTVELRAVPEARHADLTCLGYLSPVTRLVGLTTCDPRLPHDAALAAFADLVVR